MKKRSDRNDTEPLPTPFCHVLSLSHNQWETSESEHCPSEGGCWPVVTTTNKTSLDKTRDKTRSTVPYRWEANVAWFRDLMAVDDVPAFSVNTELTRRRDASQLWVITWPRNYEPFGVLWMRLKICPWEKQTNMTTSDEWKSEEIRNRRMVNWLQLLFEEEETKKSRITQEQWAPDATESDTDNK